MTSQISGQDLMIQRLPELRVGTNSTTHSALHKVKFVGRLRAWDRFEQEAAVTFGAHYFKRLPLLGQRRNDRINPLTREVYQVGDERDVQVRFGQNIGHILSIIAEDERLGFKFAGARSVELGAHDLSAAVRHFMGGRENYLRQILGQIADYMDEFSMKYGVISTYNQSIFLRQRVDGGKWCLDYSPVINHDRSFRPTRRRLYPITTRQAFMHIAHLSSQGNVFDRGQSITRNNRLWTQA
ncbi:hypothetical protein N7456_000997 [Penicillium angulare]|uniref:Uncharacterized protein n=1 Tax=Penicillium angulare TaxID=116970 RepID=A0A9W9GD73_9EURO|nr:hypothetical protein N7456_000997 [Penicillium angulare]